MSYHEKVLVHISYSDLQLILPPQLGNMTQRHKNIFGCDIYIWAGTYQESLNNWPKQILQFLNNCAKSFMSESDEKINTGNIASRYG